MPHDEVKKFLKITKAVGSSGEGSAIDNSSGGVLRREELRKFERTLDEVKGMAREVVRPLMRSYLELELGREGPVGAGLAYLTCTRLEEGDFPWD